MYFFTPWYPTKENSQSACRTAGCGVRLGCSKDKHIKVESWRIGHRTQLTFVMLEKMYEFLLKIEHKLLRRKKLLYFDRNLRSTFLKSRSPPSERVSRCSKLMAAYPPGFNDRWPCKRALAMHRPSNSSVLFSPEMQGRIEEF